MSLAYVIKLATARDANQLALWLQSNFVLAPDLQFPGEGANFIADNGMTEIQVNRVAEDIHLIRPFKDQFGFNPTQYFHIVGRSSDDNTDHVMALRITAALARNTTEDFVTYCDEGSVLAVRRHGKLTLSSGDVAYMRNNDLPLFKDLKYEHKSLGVF